MSYDHTQPGRFHYLLLFVAGILAFAAIGPRHPALILGALLFVVLAACFARLRVRDLGGRLEVAFGPLNLVRRHVAYEDLVSVEVSRSLLIEGWGVHWLPGRGWTWNIWGFDTVLVELGDGRTLRIGTDEPEALAAFLESRLTKAA